MTIAPGLHVRTVASLGVIVLMIAGAAADSLQPSPRTAPGARPGVPGAPPAGDGARRSTS